MIEWLAAHSWQELWGIIVVYPNWKLGFNQIVMFSNFLSAKLYADLNHKGMPR